MAYFLSTTISAGLFFSFTMFIFHPDKGTFKSYIEASLYAAEMIAYFFLFFFVFYSISVFLKSRYKEFGILYMMGISKKKMLKMVFIENIFISLAATLSGIVTGLIFSRLFLLMIEQLLRTQTLPFYFPLKAIWITAAAFIIMSLCVSVFTSWIIKEKDILNLLKGSKKPKPAPKASLLLAVTGVILLATGYGLSFRGNKENLDKMILIVVGLVVIATYFLFTQFSVFIIAFLQKQRYFYRKHTNLIWISNLLYRIKDNARMFFIICITSTAAFVSIGTCFAYWEQTLDSVEKKYPLAFTYQTFGENPAAGEEIQFIEQQLRKEGLSYQKIVIASRYSSSAGGESIPLIQESTYNQLAGQLGKNPVSLQDDESVKLINTDQDIYDVNDLMIDGITVRSTSEIKQKVMTDQPAILYVVSDSLFARAGSAESLQYTFNVKDWDQTYRVFDAYDQKYGSDEKSLLISKSHVYETEKRAYGTIMFLSVFIGVIFFVTSGSFIYNKFYIDVETDKKKYKQMYKIGLTYTEIRRIVTMEMGILFLLPYIAACIHSFVALSVLRHIFGIEVGTAAFLVMGSFLILQLLYYTYIRRNYLLEISNELNLG
ncbi:ABC transporter permease protein YxdM [compost metagenome]